MIWNPNKECMSRDEMSALQGKRLHKIVEYVYHNVPFYRHKLQELDIRPDDIQTIEDIRKLPFTTKKDLRDNYPFGLQAAPQSEIIRIHASSGTTGNPTIVGYTRKDIGVWSECMARCLTAYGITRDDTFSVSYGYGLFTGGLVVGDAVFEVILQDDLGCAAESGADRRQLDQYLGTVASVLDHALDRFEMPDRTREPVENRFRLGMGVGVAVPLDMASVKVMGVYDAVAVIVIIDFVAHDGFLVFAFLLFYIKKTEYASGQCVNVSTHWCRAAM